MNTNTIKVKKQRMIGFRYDIDFIAESIVNYHLVTVFIFKFN